MTRPLLPTEASGAARVVARAFAEDPLMCHLFPDAAARQRQAATYYAAALRRLYGPHGRAECAEAAGEISAVALWRKPGADAREAERALLPALRHSTGLSDFARVLRALDAFDHAYPRGDLFYLSILATSPEAQGRGLGSALVRAGTRRADRAGLPCYLETGTEANVAWYARHGFRAIHEIPLPDSGPTHWGLWRDPQASGARG